MVSDEYFNSILERGKLMKRVKVYRDGTDPIEVWEDRVPKYLENGWSETPAKQSVKRSKKEEVKKDG